MARQSCYEITALQLRFRAPAVAGRVSKPDFQNHQIPHDFSADAVACALLQKVYAHSPAELGCPVCSTDPTNHRQEPMSVTMVSPLPPKH
jgi:hypothetical protein